MRLLRWDWWINLMDRLARIDAPGERGGAGESASAPTPASGVPAAAGPEDARAAPPAPAIAPEPVYTAGPLATHGVHGRPRDPLAYPAGEPVTEQPEPRCPDCGGTREERWCGEGGAWRHAVVGWTRCAPCRSRWHRGYTRPPPLRSRAEYDSLPAAMRGEVQGE